MNYGVLGKAKIKQSFSIIVSVKFLQCSAGFPLISKVVMRLMKIKQKLVQKIISLIKIGNFVTEKSRFVVKYEVP